MSPTQIKVGGIFIKTGPQAQSFSDAEVGVRARFDKANQEHELGNRTIVFDSKDDAGDTSRNVEVARELVESDNVFGIVEVTSVSGGSASYLKDKGIPVTGWHVGAPEWAEDANMFTFRLPASATPDKEYTSRNADVIKKLGGTKVALVGGINQASVDFVNRIGASLPSAGLQLAYKTTDVTPDQRDFTGIVQRIKDSGADAMYTGLDFLQNTALSDQLSKAGVHLKVVIFPGGYDPRVLSLPGVEGAVFGLEFKPFELHTPSFQEFDKWLPTSTTRAQVSYVGWLAAETFVQGLKDAGLTCPTRKAFINNLRLEKAWTANGAFDPGDLTKDYGHEFLCTYYVRVENKQFVPLFNGQEQCGTLIKIG